MKFKYTVLFSIFFIWLVSCNNTITEELTTLNADNIIIKGENGKKYQLQVIIDKEGNPVVKAKEVKMD